MVEKEKHFVEEDDYGIETFVEKPKVQEKPVEQKTAVAEAKPEAKATTADQPEQADEDDYEAVGTQMQATKETTEEKKDDFIAKPSFTDTIMIFKDEEFFIYDWNKKSGWQLGDFNDAAYTVADNSVVLMIDPQTHQTNEFQAVSVGGYRTGEAVRSVYGLNFDLSEQNLVEYYACSVAKVLPQLLTARFMHQAVLVRGINGSQSWHILAAGGKSEPSNWLSSVESLDLTPYFYQGKLVKGADGVMREATSEWQEMAPMLSARSNFAMVALPNTVYVCGGITSAGKGDRAHRPNLVEHNIERYIIQLNKWEELIIKSAPRLAAFSWCPIIGQKGAIAVLGGSDGTLMSEELWIIDFKEETALSKFTNQEFFTGMGTLVHREKDNTLHHIGGINSQGTNYWLKMGTKEWKQSERSHSLVANASALELTNNASVYFD